MTTIFERTNLDTFADADARRRAAGWSAAQRQAHIKSMLIRYPVFDEAVAGIGRLHMPVKDGVFDRGNISGLLGASRSGKSTAIRHYVRGLGLVDKPGIRVPRAVYVDATKNMNTNTLADLLYGALNIRRRTRGGAVGHLHVIADELATHGVEMLVVDDAQWLLCHGSQRTAHETFGFLIDAAERNAFNVVLAGTPELRVAVESNHHAYGRGGFQYEMVEPFDWHSPAGRKDFRSLLSRIGARLPFRELPMFADERISAHFYKISGGLIGRVMNYVETAAYEAINEDADRVEIEHLIFAASKRRRLNDPFEPFVSDIAVDDPMDKLAFEDEAAFDEAEGDQPVTLSKRRPRAARRVVNKQEAKGRLSTIGDRPGTRRADG